MTWQSFLLALLGFGLLGPVVGCLLAGIDRKLTARLQNRVGPPLLQPYYDVRKLLAKDQVQVNRYQGFYVALALGFAIAAGVLFFAGGNFLLVAFIVTLSSLFFIVAAYSTRSPYAELGAEREIVQVMSYEPMVLLACVAFFIGSGSFNTIQVLTLDKPLVATLPLVFIGLVFILTIKLRKSPFDLSYSHHAHQELVKGISTEMSGRTLAMVEIMHWYETVLFLGWVALFLAWGSWLGAVVAVVGVLLVYFLEVLIDNTYARVKWQLMLKASWIVTFVCVLLNLFAYEWLSRLVSSLVTG
ncbi:MAG: NADH-quinone oxidoreductase subunit H [Coriobacteriales bacterium]|jgi:formate hydrogenlyase subunit 4|nr:NADH-quinone oxidoreductase subunit H [Coriobacteriales bacterium]